MLAGHRFAENGRNTRGALLSRIEKNGGSWRRVLQRGVAHDVGSEELIHLLPKGGETSQLPDGLLFL